MPPSRSKQQLLCLAIGSTPLVVPCVDLPSCNRSRSYLAPWLMMCSAMWRYTLVATLAPTPAASLVFTLPSVGYRTNMIKLDSMAEPPYQACNTKLRNLLVEWYGSYRSLVHLQLWA